MTDPIKSLCTRCGLCCNGTLFADVELTGAKESLALEAMGLTCEDDDGREILLQPCSALRGSKCTIYPYRPETCQTFECSVLQDLRLGRRTLNQSLEIINNVKRLRRKSGGRVDRQTIEATFFKSAS